MIITANTTGLNLQAKLFRGFSDPTRLAILTSLRNGPLTVTEVVALSGLSQPNTSNHPACLHDCGLVAREQEGSYVRYGLSDERAMELLNLADELLADAAKACTNAHATRSRR